MFVIGQNTLRGDREVRTLFFVSWSLLASHLLGTGSARDIGGTGGSAGKIAVNVVSKGLDFRWEPAIMAIGHLLLPGWVKNQPLVPKLSDN